MFVGFLPIPHTVFVLAPMTRGRAGAARLPNRLMAEYYAQRSSAGLLITEATTISEEANGWNESPGIYTDEMTEGSAEKAIAAGDADLISFGRPFISRGHGLPLSDGNASPMLMARRRGVAAAANRAPDVIRSTCPKL